MKDKKAVFFSALLLKVFAGLVLAFIYTNYFEGGDIKFYFEESQKIYRLSHENEVNLFQFLLNSQDAEYLYNQLAFKNQPRALLFNKIVYVFYLLAGGNFWLVSIYFSLISFTGFWVFYQTIRSSIEVPEKALVVSLFLWPSVVFWSSGLIKESISSFLILSGISVVFRILKDKKRWPLYVCVFVFCSYFLFKIKYYYAGILIPVLVAYYTCEELKRVSRQIREKMSLQMVCFVSIFGVLVFLASNLHYNLRLENITGVIIENYQLFREKSEPGKMIEFERLKPSFWSFFMYSPKALFSGLFRPNLLDIRNLWSALAGIENFILLVLAAGQLRNVKKLKKDYFLLVLSAMFFCCAMAILLSFSAPNLGTLVRYKVGFLPILLVVILARNPLLQGKNKSRFTG